MRAVLLKTHNILGFEEYELRFGSVTKITGENDTGKTSVLQSLLGVLRKGHDGTLLRAGAERGEAVLVIEEDDGSTTTISKEITPEESKRSVKNSLRGRIGADTRYIDNIVDVLAVNPIDFIRARTDKEQIAWLERFLPLEVDKKALREAVAILTLSDRDLEGNALEVIGRVRQTVYDSRTGVNRLRDEKRKTIKTLSDGLPPQVDTEVSAELEETEKDLAAFNRAVHSVEKDTAFEKAEVDRQIDRRYNEAVQQERNLAQEKIDAIKAELETSVDRLRLVAETAKQEADTIFKKKVEGQQARFNAETGRLNSNIGGLRERADAATRATNTRRYIAETEEGVKAHEYDSQCLTQSLEKLDALKLHLMEQLPVGGLEIKDGKLFHDGVPLTRVNEARKLNIALQVAIARQEKLFPAGLRFICLDDTEHLDAKNFAALERAAEALSEQGYQFLISKVTKGPLSVETH